jgi:predicted nucleic acid-binding protein
MWVVDTCIVLDVLENDPAFGRPSAKLLQKLLPQGLTISPVTMVELSAAFSGDLAEQKRFLDQAGISYEEPWTAADTELACAAWNAYVVAKRQARATRRPVADILIGGFAANRTGLVTRNPRDFNRWFPRLRLQAPSAPEPL